MASACSHRASPFNAKSCVELLQRLRPLLRPRDLAACLPQIAAAFLDNDIHELRAAMEFSAEDMVDANNLVEQAYEDLQRRISSIEVTAETYAADPAAYDFLVQGFRNLLSRPSGPQDDTTNGHTTLNLRFHGRTYRLTIPRRDGLCPLFELLILEPYCHTPITVESIVDLGAHIGTSTVYLHSIYPEAATICVEPSPAALRYLRSNVVYDNGLNAKIIPRAVCDASGMVTIGLVSSATMLNSLVFGFPFSKRCSVQTVRLGEIVPRTNAYGIKLDIEGSEFALFSDATILSNARWILGELHYGSFSRPEDVWLTELLERNFTLEWLLPRVDNYGGTFIIAQAFKAFHR